MTGDPPRRVLIGGGGVAGLETVLALLEDGRPRFDIRLLTPQRHFTYRSLTAGPPFLQATVTRVDLEAMAETLGFRLIRDAVDGVDPTARQVRTQGGLRLGYDVLVLAVGTRPAIAVPRALTFRGLQDLAAVVAALETIGPGPGRVAYVARSAAMWTLPLYEVALHTAAWAVERGATLEVLVATAERAPVEALGPRAGAAVADRLRRGGVRFISNAEIAQTDDGRLVLMDGTSLPTDLTVALPHLGGPALRGLPHLPSGFTRVDEMGRVPSAEGIYAVGDMTDRPGRRGGPAGRQGDVVARAIAAAEAAPSSPAIDDDDAIAEPVRWPANGAPGRLLGPWLAAREPALARV